MDDWEDKSGKYYIAGFFFFLLQLGVIGVFIFAQRPMDIFFWFCNHTPILFSIAFFFQMTNFIRSLINVGFLIQFIWFSDLILYFVFDYTLLGLTQYLFYDLSIWGGLFSIITHTFSTFLALYLVYKSEIDHPKVLLLSLTYLLLIYVLTLIFTDPVNNINCIHEICSLEEFTFELYSFLWPFIMYIVIVLPTHLLQKFIYDKTKFL